MIVTDCEGYLLLACAILRRAALDTASTDPKQSADAVSWCASSDCEFYCDALGLDHNRVLAIMRKDSNDGHE